MLECKVFVCHSPMIFVSNKSETPLELHEGDLAPEFSFRDRNGILHRLSDITKGKKVVVYFYPRDFTPGCTTEALDFTKDYHKFERQGIEIIGISPDDEDSHKKFTEKMKIPYPLAVDSNNLISKSYGAFGPKKFMGKDYIGINRSTFLIGKDGRILKIFRKVKPAGHSSDVLQAFVAMK